MTKYFVLSNVDQHGNIVIGRNSLWSSPYNWASYSGGNDSVGPPGSGDDVVFDVNSMWTRGTPSFNEVIIGNDSISYCRNLTVNTGFAWGLRYQSGGKLVINGQLNLMGVGGSPITINSNNYTLCYFYLLGSNGIMENVVANSLISIGGKRIYYDNIGGGCTITNCPFWLYPNPPSWVSGKKYIVGDYVFNSLFGHSYLCQYPNLSGSFGADLSLGYWVQADQNNIPAIPNQITVRVTNATELQEMLNAPDYNYVLENDIDLTGVTWTPVGTYSNPFTGSFNGQNHKISNLNYNDGLNNNYAALFGSVGSAEPIVTDNFNAYISPTIKNITLNNFILAGEYGIGALVGFLKSAQIINCHVNNVTITGNGGIPGVFGGLAGDCFGWDNIPTTILNCTVYGIVVSAINELTGVGGLIGYSSVQSNIDYGIENFIITGCFVNGINITGVDASGQIGGLIGFGEGTLEKCYAQGNMTVVNYYTGGLIGQMDLISIKDCYARVNIVTDTNFPEGIGGFFGEVDHMVCSITNCYSDGTINADASGIGIGGFFGEAALHSFSVDVFTLLNVYSVGIVTCLGTYIGGFAGHIIGSSYVTFSILNSWWYTGSFSYAIGKDEVANTTNENLSVPGYGGDETNNVRFYSPQHPVYTGLPPVSPDLQFEGENLTFKGSQLTF